MFDVCVAGGGPSGATTACYLVRKGYKVALAHRSLQSHVPRIESLAPPTVHLLRSNGFAAALEAAAVCEASGTILFWRDQPEFLSAHQKPTVLIKRAVFDETILQRAVIEGVHVRSARILRPTQVEVGWIVPFENGTSIKARYFVDAGGRASPLVHNRRRMAASTVALYGVWPLPDREMRVEARPNGWLWGAPASRETYAVALFLDPKQCAGLDDLGRRALYEKAVHDAELFRCSVGENSLGRIGICDATPYFDTNPIIEKALKVGDASLALDPISSQGLQVAIRSAWHAAIAIHTILSGNDKENAAADFYSASQGGVVQHHKAACRALYREQTRYASEAFWSLRIVAPVAEYRYTPFAVDSLLQLSPAAAICPVPAIDGDLIVRVEGLRHPNLERPIAYLNGCPAGALFRMLKNPGPLEALVARWELPLGTINATAALSWLLERQVVIPVAGDRWTETGVSHR